MESQRLATWAKRWDSMRFDLHGRPRPVRFRLCGRWHKSQSLPFRQPSFMFKRKQGVHWPVSCNWEPTENSRLGILAPVGADLTCVVAATSTATAVATSWPSFSSASYSFEVWLSSSLVLVSYTDECIVFVVLRVNIVGGTDALLFKVLPWLLSLELSSDTSSPLSSNL